MSHDLYDEHNIMSIDFSQEEFRKSLPTKTSQHNIIQYKHACKDNHNSMTGEGRKKQTIQLPFHLSKC